MIEVSDEGRVRTIRLSRAPVNALDAPLLQGLTGALDQAVADGVGGVVLTGVGRVFTAGLDLGVLSAGDSVRLRQLLAAFLTALDRLADSPIPVVAAINGASPAGGAVLAIFCDLRLMVAGDATIGLNEVKVGLYPGALILDALTRLVGRHRSGRLLSEGTLLTPDDALACGLVDEVVAAPALLARAAGFVNSVLSLPGEAYLRTRALVRGDLRARMAATRGEQRELLLSELCEAWMSPTVGHYLAQLRAAGRERRQDGSSST